MKVIVPKVINELADLVGPIYIVGGFIRNQILGVSNTESDIDICGNINSDEFKRYASVIPVNKALGTALVCYKGLKLEYTRFRKESYGNTGEHSPKKVEFVADLATDALRRDFTINSIYYDVKNSKLIDPFNGLDDAKNRLVRAFDPDFTFNDDGLRLMRLCRQACELGFSICKHTFDSARANASNLKSIAAERRRDELNKILNADLRYNVADAHYNGLKHLYTLGLFEYILPSITRLDITQNPLYHKYNVLEHTFLAVKYAHPSVRLAALMHDTGKPVCKARDGNMHKHALESALIASRELGQDGLKYPKEVVRDVERLCMMHMYDLKHATSEGKLRLFIARNKDYIARLQLLCEADGRATGKENYKQPRFLSTLNAMEAECVPFNLIDLKISGRDLVEAGYVGKAIGEKLNELWTTCVLNPHLNNREWLLKAL